MGRPGVDRSICFVVGELPEGERKQLRGVVFDVPSKVDALRTFRDLHRMAKEAVASGETADFLDALDRRARTSRDTGPTFAAFAEEWKTNCVLGGGLRESQVETDLSILKNHLLPVFGRLFVRDIDARSIDRYKAAKRHERHQYGSGYSAKTVNNHLSVLHRIFEKAIEYRIIEKNPVSKSAWMKPETTPEESQNWLTPEEEAKVFAVLVGSTRETDPLAYNALLTQLTVGLRFGELRALEKADLDLATPGIWVRRAMARKAVSTPKNKRARFHVIPAGLAEELRRWMLRTEGQLLFPGKRGGPVPNNSLNRWWRKVCQAAGVRAISSHGARHTSGSSYAYQGASQKVIAGLLGHANTGATERYTHVQVAATAPLVEARWARLVASS